MKQTIINQEITENTKLLITYTLPNGKIGTKTIYLPPTSKLDIELIKR